MGEAIIEISEVYESISFEAASQIMSDVKFLGKAKENKAGQENYN